MLKIAHGKDEKTSLDISQTKPLILKGEDIERFYAIGSMYNNGCVGVESNKKYYRLRVEELNRIKDQLRFKVDLASKSGDRRRTNNYIEIVE
jgi:hypothetical protein